MKTPTGKKWAGIRRRGNRWQVFVKIAGKFRPKYFPLTTPPEEMQEWRDAEKTKYAPRVDSAGSFGADIQAYLRRKAAMPTIEQRAAHLELWAQALGRDRSRTSITAEEIDQVMQVWLMTPTNQPDPTIRGRRGRPSAPGGLAKETVKKRRAALRNFFNVMNGSKKDGVNPVRSSQCPIVSTELEARGILMADAARIVAAMPEWVDVKKGAIPIRARGRLFADAMLWTGLPPILLNAIRPGHLALDATVPTMGIRRRDKGQGVEARTVPIGPQAVTAFRRIAAAGVFGQLPANLNQSVKRAAKRAGVSVPADFHLYDIRHSYGSALYRQTRDEGAVGRALIHAKNSRMARRYTEAAHREVDAAGVAALGQTYAALMAPSPAPETAPDKCSLPQPPAFIDRAGLPSVSAQKLPPKVATSRKRREKKHLRIAS
jgi:integrase